MEAVALEFSSRGTCLEAGGRENKYTTTAQAELNKEIKDVNIHQLFSAKCCEF